MSKHFIDKINSLSRQSISAAAIVDSDGDMAGKVLIRFTDSQYGWNHEVGVTMWRQADNGRQSLDFGRSSKGGTYNRPGTLYFMLREAGFRCFMHGGKEIGDYENKTGCNYDSLSSFSDIAFIKQGNRKFRLLWIV